MQLHIIICKLTSDIHSLTTSLYERLHFIQLQNIKRCSLQPCEVGEQREWVLLYLSDEIWTQVPAHRWEGWGWSECKNNYWRYHVIYYEVYVRTCHAVVELTAYESQATSRSWVPRGCAAFLGHHNLWCPSPACRRNRLGMRSSRETARLQLSLRSWGQVKWRVLDSSKLYVVVYFDVYGLLW